MILSSSASLAIRVGGAIASFGFQIVLARLLGPAHLGVYHASSTLAQLLSVAGRRGLDSILVKHVSVAYARGSHAETHAIAASVVREVVKLTSVVMVVMMVVAVLAGQRWLAHDDAVPSLLIFLLATVPLALVATYGEALKSIDRPLVSAVVQGLAVPVLNLTAIALLGAHVHSATGASWVFLMSVAVVAAVGALVCRKAIASSMLGEWSSDIRRLTVEARPFFVAAVASMLCGSADLLILSVYGSPAEVGIYAVASRIAVLFALVSLGINGVVAPQFARLSSEKNIAGLQMLSFKACLMSAGAGLPVLLVAVLAPVWIMGMFGPQFTGGALVLQLVVAGRYVNLVSGPLGHLFQMAGRPRIERDLLVGTAIAVIALTTLLTFLYGVTGTAIAAGTAWAGLGLARIIVAATLFRTRQW